RKRKPGKKKGLHRALMTTKTEARKEERSSWCYHDDENRSKERKKGFILVHKSCSIGNTCLTNNYLKDDLFST
ncbi:hypothetical protein J7I91_14605, partial [Pseudomonas sp. ISL-84]|nr:hypothetical protein [Pseudomonas sp. ISL-84]